MKFSESWLREIIDLNLSSNELSHKLTMIGHELDGISKDGLSIQGIIIGIAILRRYKNNYIWLKIYGLVTIGVLCTGFKWPKNPVWGYHEILHCSVILMNLVGIVTEISRNF